RRIRADERTGADVGLELGKAVVVAGDRSRPDVGARADTGIADIAQMIDLRAGLDARRLDLHEVSDLGFAGDLSARAKPGIRPDRRAGADMRALEMGERMDNGAVVDRHAGTEDDIRLDQHVAADFGI